jgi:LysM repeat protein
MVFPPRGVDAFWPFSITKAEDKIPPIVHDSTMDLLSPAQNPDPNPFKGGIDILLSGGSALISNSGPEGTVTDFTEGVPNSGQISLHVVREGESLSVIASLYQVTTNTILWANDIKDASTIQPGDTLLILPVSGVQHTVTKGQTLASISKKYDADPEEVASFNGLDVDSALAVGDTLIIPGGDLLPKKSTSTASKSSSGGVISKALPALSGYYSNPVPGARLTQGVHGYNGVDLGAKNGTSVYASADGTVIVAKGGGGYNGGYGNYLVISHANGTQTLYAHLSSLAVSGGSVSQGDLIGYVGNTGRSTGFHLHFEVRGAKNPFAY